MKRFKRTCRWLGWTSLAISLVIVAFLVRLSLGPMSISWLAPLADGPVEASFPNAHVEYSSPSLAWDRAAGSIDLVLENVRLNDSSTGLAAEFPKISIAFSEEAMIRGLLAPSRIVLSGAELSVIWSRDDLIRLAQGRAIEDEPGAPARSAISGAADADRRLIELTNRFLRPPEGDDRLGYLRSLVFRDITIRLTESVTGTQWTVPAELFQFTRSGGRITLTGKARLITQTSDSGFSIATEAAEEGLSRLRLTLDDLLPNRLAAEVGLDGIWRSVDAPFSGNVMVEFTRGKGLVRAEFDLSLGEGRVVLPDIFNAPPTFEFLAVRGDYDPSTRQINFISGDAILGDHASLMASGFLILPSEDVRPHLRLDLLITDLGVDKLLEYWPATLAPGTSAWLRKNMLAGQFNNAEFRISIRPDYWGQKPLPEDAIFATFDVEDASFLYLGELPPLTDVQATAILKPNRLSVKVASALVDGMQIGESNLEVVDIAFKGKAVGTFVVRLSSEVPELLRLVDHKPLEYMSRFNIDPDMIQGHAETVLNLTLPLIAGVKIDEIDISVDSDVLGMAVPSLLNGGGLSDGRLRFNITQNGLSARGDILLKGAPFSVHWAERFGDRDGPVPPTRYQLFGTLNAEELERFGVPAVGHVKGRVWASLELFGRGGQLLHGQGEIDFFESAVAAEELGWAKPAHQPGVVRFKLAWRDEFFELGEIVLDSPEFSSRGWLRFDLDSGDLIEGELPRLRTTGHDIAMKILAADDGKLQLDITGKRIDARRFIDQIYEPGDGSDRSLRISVNVDEIETHNGTIISAASFKGESLQGFWSHVEFSGVFEGDKPISLVMAPSDSGRSLRIETADGGSFARSAGIFVNGVGGDLVLDAVLGATGEDKPLAGNLKVTGFDIKPSAEIIELLAAREDIDPAGKDVDEFLDGEVMQMDLLDMDFSFHEGLIDISDAQARGNGNGFTFRGQIDQRREKIAVSGIVVPVYALNSLLGKVPIIGELLTGGEGGGLFAVTYKMEGPLDDPKITINPLSALTPGIFRKILIEPRDAMQIKPAVCSDEEDDDDDEDCPDDQKDAEGSKPSGNDSMRQRQRR